MNRLTRRAAPIVAVATMITVLAACGSPESGGASSTGAGAGPDRTRISVGNFPNTLLTLPLGVAEGEGLFAREGLAVDIVPASGGPQLIAAMLGGTTQFTPVPASVAIAAMAQGQDLKVLPPFEQENLVFTVPGESDIKDVQGLVGKRVGVAVRGGAAEIFATEVLKEHHVDPEKVTFVAAGTAATMSAALENKQVDALVTSNPSNVALAQSRDMRVIASALDGSAGVRGRQGIASFYVTTPEYFEKNKKTVNDFCRALTGAAAWIADEANRDKTISYIQKWTGVNDQKALKTLYETEHAAWQEKMDKQRWETNVGFGAPGKDLSYDLVTPSCN